MATSSAAYEEAWKILQRVRALQTCLNTPEYDEPEIIGTELHFRIGYQRGLAEGWPDWARSGEWSGYTVSGAPGGLWDVDLSTKQERSGARGESLKCSFTRMEDAVKFVAVSVGDSVRSRLGMETLFVRYRGEGLDARLIQQPPREADLRHVLSHYPSDKDALVRGHLKSFALTSDTSAYAVGFPGVIPYLNVMPRTYSELEESMLEGLSDTVRQCIVGADPSLS